MKPFRIIADKSSPSSVQIIDLETGADIADRVLGVEIHMEPNSLITATLKMFAEVDVRVVQEPITHGGFKFKMSWASEQQFDVILKEVGPAAAWLYHDRLVSTRLETAEKLAITLNEMGKVDRAFEVLNQASRVICECGEDVHYKWQDACYNCRLKGLD
jgi:hypothetical protein